MIWVCKGRKWKYGPMGQGTGQGIELASRSAEARGKWVLSPHEEEGDGSVGLGLSVGVGAMIFYFGADVHSDWLFLLGLFESAVPL